MEIILADPDTLCCICLTHLVMTDHLKYTLSTLLPKAFSNTEELRQPCNKHSAQRQPSTKARQEPADPSGQFWMVCCRLLGRFQ